MTAHQCLPDRSSRAGGHSPPRSPTGLPCRGHRHLDHLSILGRILFEIARPSDTHKLDARDKDISRFGEYGGGSVLAVGMLVPFVLALVAANHFWIANAMYATFALSAIVGTTTKLVAYRRGL
jgi:hypothetical protein